MSGWLTRLIEWFAGTGARSTALALDTKLALPAHAIYVHWEFAGRAAAVEFDITIHNDPGTRCGEYLSPFNGDIDGHQIYFGIQTNVYRPERPEPDSPGSSIGKGVIFSTWWSYDMADARVAEDGFAQRSNHEGRFIGIRRPYDWSVGSYRLTVARGEADREADWFDLSITPIGDRVGDELADGSPRPAVTGPTTWIGALRFDRRDPNVPATLSPAATTFLEVYSNARTFGEIEPWHCDLAAFADGLAATSARTEYPTYPHNQDITNADAWWDADRRRAHLTMGGTTERHHPPGTSRSG
jgi:hypothetical protein